ncbi:MAG: hypothetical protein LBU62_07080 [Bacteroidales bacterium]|jgi:hypothetical protein|nr:hypothetical protein [Bacteroidales bacterium]
MIKVKNLNGTKGLIPNGYGSWLEYWEAKSGQRATKCMRVGCSVTGRSNLVGAHVKKVGSYDNSWYIVPLCQADNMRTDEFSVSDLLVPVNP